VPLSVPVALMTMVSSVAVPVSVNVAIVTSRALAGLNSLLTGAQLRLYAKL
jgi:hypothetical protein